MADTQNHNRKLLSTRIPDHPAGPALRGVHRPWMPRPALLALIAPIQFGYRLWRDTGKHTKLAPLAECLNPPLFPGVFQQTIVAEQLVHGAAEWLAEDSNLAILQLQSTWHTTTPRISSGIFNLHCM